MKYFNLVFVLGVGMSVSALATDFPYGVAESEMTVRFQADATYSSSLAVSEVPSVDGGMPKDDTLVQAITRTLEFAATDVAHWDELVASFSEAAQFALALKDDEGLRWMCYSSGMWIELEGPVATEGTWTVRVSIDYSLPEGERAVRYEVSSDGGANYTPLTREGVSWLPLGVSRTSLDRVGVVGYGELGATVVKSARRPLSGEIILIENIGMDYDSLNVDISVKDGWGVEGADVHAVLKNRTGETVDVFDGVLKDGHLCANFSDVVHAGEEYSCEVSISKESAQGPETSSIVKLFADVDWFGFDGGQFVRANPESLIVVSDGAFGTSGAIGQVLPVSTSPAGSETVIEARVSVNGVCQQDDLPDVDAQFAILPMRTKNEDVSTLGERCWAVKDGAGAWLPLLSGGVSAANGEYDIRVVLDYRDGQRVGCYYIRPAGVAEYVKLAEFALGEASLHSVGVKGGQVCALNASYRTTSPIDVVPDAQSTEIVLQGHANIDLSKVACKAYEVKSAGSIEYRIRWSDEVGENGRYATFEDGTITVKTGAPANGMESFTSYVLGLNPDKASDKPFLKSEEGASSGKITLSFNGIEPKTPEVTGLSIKYVVESAGDLTFAGATKTEGDTPSVTVDLPAPSAGESAVRYYRPRFELK